MEAPEETEEAEGGKKKKKKAEETEKGLRALLEQQSEMLGALMKEMRRMGRRMGELEAGVDNLVYTIDGDYVPSEGTDETEDSGESEVADETEESEEEEEGEEEKEEMAVD
jgi:hypothetical protein